MSVRICQVEAFLDCSATFYSVSHSMPYLRYGRTRLKNFFLLFLDYFLRFDLVLCLWLEVTSEWETPEIQ